MKVICDLHVHSLDFSGDAVSYMDEMCQGAIDKGLKRLCFTEHVDFDPNYDDSIPFDPEKYDVFIEKMRDAYGDKLEILKGVEIGEPHMYPWEYEKMISRDYDMVMVGLHYVNLPMGLHWTGNGGRDIFTFAVDRIYRRYYEELLATVELGGFDVLAHFDYPKRYLKKDADEYDLIREILSVLVKNGGILEINTSPWRKGCSEPAPSQKILSYYKEAGGTKLTIGSDAHDVKDIGADLDRAIAAAEGFTRGYFKGRQFFVLE
ncbi:MAG: histidinol-phosphatase HisJ family protein [Bacillota bacterium]|nr:histidinol-phosphatase HisJ family protein [Bacillota bacterium]